jgi:signal transduction histidine kinase
VTGSNLGRTDQLAGVPRGLAGPLVALALVTSALAAHGDARSAALRHLYLVPVLWAACTSGMTSAGVVGLLAGLLQAPFAFRGIERFGLGAEGVDSLVAMVVPAAAGLVAGWLADQSRARAMRLGAVLDIQRSLVAEVPFEQRMELAADRVRTALGVDRVGLLIGHPGEQPLVASAPPGSPVAEDSSLSWAYRERQSIFAGDLEQDPRFGRRVGTHAAPLRGLVMPLDAGAGPLGALAVERAGDLTAPMRSAASDLALHLALAVDNAWLTLRQRRFTAELEDKISAATERLRELDRAKSEFVSVVAHELRTPLTALQGFSELLLSREVTAERRARFLGHIHSEAQRLGRIVTELLDVSRIDSGRPVQLSPRPLDLSDLLERNAELFAVEHQDHRFAWTAQPGLEPIHADADAVERIVKNLISNAVKYSPGGGRVRLAAGPAPGRPGMVVLSVEDDGVGIPASELPRVFDRYVRIPNRETTAVRGLGLGLALVRGLAEAHGGSAEVESTPGKGSIFRVLLPVKESVSANFTASSA